MIKGTRRDMIHLRETGSPYFEEAYFIVRRGSEIDVDEGDMVREAEGIVRSSAESLKRSEDRKKRARRRIFCLGLSVCSFLFGAVMLVYTLLAG